MLIDLHPVVLFEVHWVLFKDNLDLSLVGDLKDNEARELGTDRFRDFGINIYSYLCKPGKPLVVMPSNACGLCLTV